ncbi:MAG: galactokinase [Bacteroidetes bacterium]|nr:galactokinase [Bacteroidota bacterium]
MNINALTQLFNQRYNRVPLVVRAPGRINLIGEHTDYNGGFVMPAAIDKHFLFAAAAHPAQQFTICALDFNEDVSFSLNELKPGHRWVNYLMGVVEGFVRRGKEIGGVKVLFKSNIPPGAGLSSSAALCSGFGFVLNELFQCRLSRLDLALIAQEAEDQFAGAKVGLMDMYASLFSKPESVMLMDCRSHTHEYIPFHTTGFELLLIDTKVKHALASSAYNHRRQACEEGVKIIQRTQAGVQSLRDVSETQLLPYQVVMGEEIFKRCHYVVKEIKRTETAAGYLKRNEWPAFGKLMYETHEGLSVEYEVSCPESDWIVNTARESRITGARQMGGGFGGCVLCLISQPEKKMFIEKVQEKYFAQFKKEPDFYSVELSEGVSRIEF